MKKNLAIAMVIAKWKHTKKSERQLMEIARGYLIRDTQMFIQKKDFDQLEPFRDEQGIWRVNGRLQNAASLSFDAKHPILIPREALLLEALIFSAHVDVAHQGTDKTRVKLREKFWCPKASAKIKSIVEVCTTCRRTSSEQFFKLKQAPLPPQRVSEFQPFSHIGVDHPCPYYNDNREKRYILIFTCYQTRAIHLELCHNAGVESTIAAWNRFVARRGIPAKINSDGAGALNATADKLKAMGLSWDNIPANSPHRGGN